MLSLLPSLRNSLISFQSLMSNLLPSLQNSLISFHWPAQAFDLIRYIKKKSWIFAQPFYQFWCVFRVQSIPIENSKNDKYFPSFAWLCYQQKISKFTQNVIDIQGCLALISAFNSLIFVLINLVYVLHHPNTRIKKQLSVLLP